MWNETRRNDGIYFIVNLLLYVFLLPQMNDVWCDRWDGVWLLQFSLVRKWKWFGKMFTMAAEITNHHHCHCQVARRVRWQQPKKMRKRNWVAHTTCTRIVINMFNGMFKYVPQSLASSSSSRNISFFILIDSSNPFRSNLRDFFLVSFRLFRIIIIHVTLTRTLVRSHTYTNLNVRSVDRSIDV